MKELLNRRAKTMKVFEKAPGEQLYRCHIGNIHYPDSAKIWQDIDTALLTKAGGFYQDKCFYSCEIPDKADGEFKFFNRDHHFNLKLVGVGSVGYKPIPGSKWGELGKGIQYTDAFGSGIHFEVIAANMKFNKRIRFDKPPPDITKDFYFDYEILSKPDILTVQNRLGEAPTPLSIDKGSYTATRLTDKIIALQSSVGEHKSYIFKPFCNDSGEFPKILHVGIVLFKKNGRFYLRKIIPKEIFKNAVYPIFADDPTRYDPTAGDGYIDIGYNAWDTSHDAISGSGADYTYSQLEVTIFRDPSGNWSICRVAVPTNTNGISDTIMAATLYMHGNGTTKNDNFNGYLTICETFQASTTQLVVADYEDIGSDNGNAARAKYTPMEEGNTNGDRLDITNWDVNAYNTIDLDSQGIGWINKNGISMLGVREKSDVEDIDNGGSGYAGSRVRFYSSERTGTSEDVYLDVTVSAAGWSNKIQGVSSPAKIIGIANTSIAKVIGV